MRKTILAVIGAVLMLPAGILAQEDEEPAGPLASVWFIVPKAGMEAEFTEAAAAEIVARKEAGESREWNAYRVVVGDNLRAVQYRSCCYNWADEDTFEAEDLELGLGESWNENVGPYVDHYHHYFERMDWENSHWPDTGTDGPFYGVTSWTVRQGGAPSVREARIKLSRLGLDDGWASDDNNWLWMTRIGGKPKLMIVSSYENYADMAPPEQTFFAFVNEKLGAEEAAAVFKQFSSGFENSDYTVWRHDEELSTPADDE